MLPIYQALGLTAGLHPVGRGPTHRRRATKCGITYRTNSGFGFDYLPDNMKPAA